MFQYAKKYIKENSKYSPTILKNTPPSQKFPLVIIKSLTDPLYDENLDKTDQRFKFGYLIEIYSMNKGNIAKEIITEEIVDLLNNVYDEHYGMNRTFNEEVPNVDADVYRWQMRFEAKIDENKIIYRR